jgi:hypothetical protein
MGISTALSTGIMQEDSLPGNGQQRTLAGTTGREFISEDRLANLRSRAVMARRRQVNESLGVGGISGGLLAKHPDYTH